MRKCRLINYYYNPICCYYYIKEANGELVLKEEEEQREKRAHNIPFYLRCRTMATPLDMQSHTYSFFSVRSLIFYFVRCAVGFSMKTKINFFPRSVYGHSFLYSAHLSVHFHHIFILGRFTFFFVFVVERRWQRGWWLYCWLCSFCIWIGIKS